MFPYEVYSQYSHNTSNAPPGTSGSNFTNQKSYSDVESKTAEFVKSIANYLIQKGDEGETVNKIPQEVIILGSIFLSKTCLFLALRSAKKAGLNLSEL